MTLFRLLAVAALAGVLTESAQAEDPPAACAALANSVNAVRFTQLIDAPTTILSARLVAAGGDGTIIENDFPEHCRIEGQVAPTVGFLLRMPTRSWNGKFMFGGCGGPCGNYLTDRVDPALARHYAVVVTDMGHKGQGWGWAWDNLPGQIDFGWRSTHVTAIAAKAIVAEFYGKAASKNYYFGCSTGGRQGMVSAQRFPKDFDGIVAGAPVWNQTGNNPYFGSWNAVVNIDRKTMQPILDSSKLPLIHKAVMAACDAIDGLADGLLQDPRRCAWDPAEILCKGRAADNCLTKPEADVVRKIYQGATNAQGEPFFFGMARGSEDQWAPVWINAKGLPGAALGGPGLIANSMQQYVSFYTEAGPFYSAMDFDYERDPERLAMKEYIFNAQNPDLRKFKKAGGKLILYTGWHDNNIPPEAAIDYYETATQTMGGAATTMDFFRLFMLPAVNHCRYGFGGGEVDWITAIENWIERGIAPEQVIAHHITTEPYPSIERPGGDPGDRLTRPPRHPLPVGSFDRARPVYPYPEIAEFSGSGDAAKPENWRKAAKP